MSRWKELPDSQDQRVRQFVVQLRRLKDRSGLSVATIATRTGYGRSSWERYLNGRSLPSAAAVEALARTCGTDAARLLALREVAEAAWGASRDTGEPPRGADDADDADNAGGTDDSGGTGGVWVRRLPWVAMAVSSLATALLMLGLFALLRPWSGGAGDDAKADPYRPYTGEPHPEYGEFDYRPDKAYDCAVRRDEDGRLYAGYSRTRTEMIERTSTRWSVVEAQCLLRHHGEAPGVADGAFGNATERAVKRLQDAGHIAVDGKVGPDTWKVLRT
ncbi:helix-turn-helix domain-containing protein [Streptomyces boluensis]|uniref:Helix-turn-helix domain-containing protein n=1 Tax=Streptomyces boluensis TaxID=1775135 RepID=A0A964V185_9ACTN|nr:helix-turn-helix domain-containing protein [Streptomyces boluensis]NBE56717.1 helix-turn-helix domain-containing protein [Streptomyces boluensis]